MTARLADLIDRAATIFAGKDLRAYMTAILLEAYERGRTDARLEQEARDT